MGLICLQGGREFHAECREMDAFLLDAARGGPVVIAPLASKRGFEWDTTGADGVRHFTGLGANDVTVADPDAPADAIRRAALLVLPGGSPRRLRDALLDTAAGAAVRDAAQDDDRVVMGASAGAMVLCAWTVLPEGRPEVANGLGVVADFAVLPHYRGPNAAWEDLLQPKGVDLLGIPECSGVLIDGENVTAAGARAPTLITADGRDELAVP